MTLLGPEKSFRDSVHAGFATLRTLSWLLLSLGAAVAGSGCSGPGSAEVLPPLPMHGVWHRVQEGETLAVIAARYGVPGVDIEEINGLDPRRPPRAGVQLFIPGAHAPGKAQRPPAGSAPPVAGRQDPPAGGWPAKAAGPGGLSGGGSDAGSRGQPGESPGELTWPVPGGTLSAGFGTRGGRPHEGIDITAPQGTAVLAAGDGTVIYAGDGVQGYGNMILLRHKSGWVTVYAHNHRNHVSDGVEVKKGQVIAEVGSTGRAQGTHLHFELRQGETPLDPMQHVKP